MNDNESGGNLHQDLPDGAPSAAAEPSAVVVGPRPSRERVVPASAEPRPTCGTPACPTCSAGQSARAARPETSYVYAIGHVEHRFSTLAIEKELAQAASADATASLTDRAVVTRALHNTDNRYIARQMCWVLTIEGMDTYLLQPRDSTDLDMLLGTLRAEPRRSDIDVVIGVRGPVAPPDLCNGLMLPIVFVDQLYSFDTDSLLNAIPRPELIEERDFRSATYEVLDRIRGMADNAGSSDEHRALNYLVVRAPSLYAKTAEQFGRDYSLTAVNTRRSALSQGRRIVEVVLSYTDRRNDFTEKWFLRVDVTEQFPFLVTKLSPYFDR